MGGFESALFLWDSVSVSQSVSLLHRAGIGMEILTETEKKLNQIQYWFISLNCQIGKGTPRVSLLWDTNMLDMSF